MSTLLPNKEAAAALLRQHVSDEYHLHHALMVATAMEGYAHLFAASATQGADAPPGLGHLQDSNPAFGASTPAHPPAKARTRSCGMSPVCSTTSISRSIRTRIPDRRCNGSRHGVIPTR
ncbi:MAG: hypothetical protein WDM96_06835 [Lacunisphaera sp.]